MLRLNQTDRGLYIFFGLGTLRIAHYLESRGRSARIELRELKTAHEVEIPTKIPDSELLPVPPVVIHFENVQAVDRLINNLERLKIQMKEGKIHG